MLEHSVTFLHLPEAVQFYSGHGRPYKMTSMRERKRFERDVCTDADEKEFTTESLRSCPSAQGANDAEASDQDDIKRRLQCCGDIQDRRGINKAKVKKSESEGRQRQS